MSNLYTDLTLDDKGVAWLTLDRPEVHNAFDDIMIEQLIEALETTDRDPNVRLLVLRATGKNFSAGADLAWMKRMAKNSHQQNLEDAERLALLMKRLNDFTKPTLALIKGAVYGGAVGLAACCDIVIATKGSSFCLSEVRIGLIPAVISPYVIRAIGERQARRYFITAEPFNASTAQQLGLVHELADDDSELDSIGQRLLKQLHNNSPQAVVAAKSLIHAVSHQTIDQALISDTAQRIADIRVSDEGQEGLTAFLNKRQPKWIKE